MVNLERIRSSVLFAALTLLLILSLLVDNVQAEPVPATTPTPPATSHPNHARAPE
ncbi:hypothetical protein V5O48_008224 [Marasmius crinis-equi]|uniref:Uncharacterized protein n=1 Tax=Marasmius crinis-equi TaxID=585013 RepID=A0ABR3FEM8_9AGAR